MTDFHDEKKSAAENGSAQQVTSLTNTNGDRIMKKMQQKLKLVSRCNAMRWL